MSRLERTLWIWIGGGILSIVLNLILVPISGIIGAAISQTVSFFSIALGMVVGAQLLYPLQLDWARLTCIFVGILLMAIIMMPAWADTPMKSLLFKMPVGIATTIVVLSAVAPEVWQAIRWKR